METNTDDERKQKAEHHCKKNRFRQGIFPLRSWGKSLYIMGTFDPVPSWESSLYRMGSKVLPHYILGSVSSHHHCFKMGNIPEKSGKKTLMLGEIIWKGKSSKVSIDYSFDNY